MLWRCWLGDRKGIRPVQTEWSGAGVVICLERGADMPMAQLMPLPLNVSCFSKIQIGFTFLVPAHLGSPRQRAVKRVCVCVLNPAFYTDSDHVQQKSMQTLLQGLADNKVLYKSTTYLKSISSSSHLVSEVPAGYNDLLKANTRDLWSRFCTRQTSLLLFNEEHSIEEKITVSKQQLMILPRRCR